nr:uncharacterized protein LOC102125450 isoform X3 [Macaca fascicularis]
MVRSWAVGPSLSLLGLQCSRVTSAPHDGGGGRAPGGGGGGPGPPRASPPLPAPPTALLLAAQQQAATGPTPGRAGSDLNPKVLLNPMLHRTFGRGGAPWGLLRAHVAEPTRIKACPRLHHTSV